jgi:hypothetical protein
VFGICFGAQALARALGGSVVRAAHPEIGWTSIDSDVPELIEAGPWFQWHSDRFTLPPGAVELARNAVAVQAYRVGRSLGVQFHPEVARAGIARWVGNGETRRRVRSASTRQICSPRRTGRPMPPGSGRLRSSRLTWPKSFPAESTVAVERLGPYDLPIRGRTPGAEEAPHG